MSRMLFVCLFFAVWMMCGCLDSSTSNEPEDDSRGLSSVEVKVSLPYQSISSNGASSESRSSAQNEISSSSFISSSEYSSSLEHSSSSVFIEESYKFNHLFEALSCPPITIINERTSIKTQKLFENQDFYFINDQLQVFALDTPSYKLIPTENIPAWTSPLNKTHTFLGQDSCPLTMVETEIILDSSKLHPTVNIFEYYNIQAGDIHRFHYLSSTHNPDIANDPTNQMINIDDTLEVEILKIISDTLIQYRLSHLKNMGIDTVKNDTVQSSVYSVGFNWVQYTYVNLFHFPNHLYGPSTDSLVFNVDSTNKLNTQSVLIRNEEKYQFEVGKGLLSVNYFGYRGNLDVQRIE